MLFPGKLEAEFFGKARLVPANAFVDPLGFDLIEQCEVAIQHHAASAHIVDQVAQGHCLEAWGDRAFATIGFIHFPHFVSSFEITFRVLLRRAEPSWGSSARRRRCGGRCRAMAVPCSPMAASPLCRTSMITSWSYVSMACVQRALPSNLARFQRASSAVSTFRAAVSNADRMRFPRGSHAVPTPIPHSPIARSFNVWLILSTDRKITVRARCERTLDGLSFSLTYW